jgi:TolA-binding protein
MGWMSGEQAELEFSKELDGPLSELRRKTRSCPRPELLRAAEAGVLAAEQAEAITLHLDGCRFCKSLLADMEELDNRDLDIGTQERIWARVQQGVQRRTPAREFPYFSWLWWRQPLPAAALVAALIVLAIGIGFMLNRRSSSARLAQGQHVSPVQTVFKLEKAPVMLPAAAIVWRGQEDASGKQAKELEQALAPYQAGDYAEAANRLEALRQKYPKMAETSFYLGVCRLFLNKDADAAAALKDAVNQAESPLADQATWYLALAYQRTGKADLASGLLEPLCKAGKKDSGRACAGLKELKERH